jgi:Arc/MetJ-type ribon-helix-helix transcriptional regulator
LPTDYTTESEIIREGLRALSERNTALETWLRTEGVARYDAYKRDPRGRPAEKVFAQLRQHHAKQAEVEPYFRDKPADLRVTGRLTRALGWPSVR